MPLVVPVIAATEHNDPVAFLQKIAKFSLAACVLVGVTGTIISQRIFEREVREILFDLAIERGIPYTILEYWLEARPKRYARVRKACESLDATHSHLDVYAAICCTAGDEAYSARDHDEEEEGQVDDDPAEVDIFKPAHIPTEQERKSSDRRDLILVLGFMLLLCGIAATIFLLTRA